MSGTPMTIPDIVRLVTSLAGPTTEAYWNARGPGEWPAVCRFCGDPVTIELVQDGASWRVCVSHDVPVCPEFVRFCEDVQP